MSGRFLVAAIAALCLVAGNLAGTANALPDAPEAAEAAMDKVRVGKPVKLNAPTGKVGFTVKSIRFADYRGSYQSGRIALTIVVRNFSKTAENGIQANLRCGSSPQEGGFYADSTIDAQVLPPRTQEAGVLLLGMPISTAESGRPCTNARVVLKPTWGHDFGSGQKSFAAVITVPRSVASSLR